MALHRAVRRLILIHAARWDEHRGHHGQIAVRGRHHIWHHIAVIVLARPYKTALGTDHARDRVVDQRVEILDSQLLELRFVLGIVNLLENVLECMVILLGDRVLRREPQILFRVDRIAKARPRKAGDRILCVVDALYDAGAGKIVNQLPRLRAVLRGKDQLRLSPPRDLDLRVLVHIAVRMAGDRDRLRPVLHIRDNPLDQDGRAEHGPVKDRPDRAVRALPHLFQIILGHPRGVRRDRRTFDRHTVLFGRLRGIHRHLIIRLVAVLQTEIIVLGL